MHIRFYSGMNENGISMQLPTLHKRVGKKNEFKLDLHQKKNPMLGYALSSITSTHDMIPRA